MLGAVSVAVGVQSEGTVATNKSDGLIRIEHPSGTLEVAVELDGTRLRMSAVVRTARKLSDGLVFPRMEVA